MNKFFGAILGILASMSLLLTIIYIAIAMEGKDERAGWGAVAFCAVMAVCFLIPMLRIKKNLQVKKQEEEERLLIQMAKKHGGRLTAAEVAGETELTLEQSSKLLEKMCKYGAAGVQVTDSGSTVYVLEGLLSKADKGTSKSAMKTEDDEALEKV